MDDTPVQKNLSNRLSLGYEVKFLRYSYSTQRRNCRLLTWTIAQPLCGIVRYTEWEGGEVWKFNQWLCQEVLLLVSNRAWTKGTKNTQVSFVRRAKQNPGATVADDKYLNERYGNAGGKDEGNIGQLHVHVVGYKPNIYSHSVSGPLFACAYTLP